MTSDGIRTPPNPDGLAALAALKRAAAQARKTAIETNTGIVIVVDGKMRCISADELRREAELKAGKA